MQTSTICSEVPSVPVVADDCIMTFSLLDLPEDFPFLEDDNMLPFVPAVELPVQYIPRHQHQVRVAENVENAPHQPPTNPPSSSLPPPSSYIQDPRDSSDSDSSPSLHVDDLHLFPGGAHFLEQQNEEFIHPLYAPMNLSPNSSSDDTSVSSSPTSLPAASVHLFYQQSFPLAASADGSVSATVTPVKAKKVKSSAGSTPKKAKKRDGLKSDGSPKKRVERLRGACEKHKRDRKRCPVTCTNRTIDPQGNLIVVVSSTAETS